MRIVLALTAAVLAASYAVQARYVQPPDGIARMVVFYANYMSPEHLMLTQLAPNQTVNIDGPLRNLPVGEYVGLVHTAMRFNGRCETAGPLFEVYDKDRGQDRPVIGFPPTVQRESHRFSASSNDISLYHNVGHYMMSSLILFYPVISNNTDFAYEPKKRRVLPSPVACGYVVPPYWRTLLDLEIYSPTR